MTSRDPYVKDGVEWFLWNPGLVADGGISMAEEVESIRDVVTSSVEVDETKQTFLPGGATQDSKTVISSGLPPVMLSPASSLANLLKGEECFGSCDS